MDQALKVAVVRAGDRRTAVRSALGLIVDDLRDRARPEVLIKPNLVSHRRQLPSTHAETLAAALDALESAGARRFLVAEGASDAAAGFRRFGHRRVAATYDARFFDINRDETEWVPLELTAVDGATLVARVSRTVIDAPCRVSLAVPKTHVNAMLTLSLKNMLSSIHPADRVMMHGSPGGGNGYQGWRRLAVEFLKGDGTLVNVLTRTMGRLKNARTAMRDARRAGDPYHLLSRAEVGFLRTVAALNHNLVALSRVVRPHVSVVDGFVGMHREGPRHGTPIRLGTVVVGTDPVAVDAVAAAVMGFDPRQVGYLAYAEAAGLGVADLDRITVVGDPIARVCRRCVPHSNHRVQRHWSRLDDLSRRGPHSTAVRSSCPKAAAR